MSINTSGIKRADNNTREINGLRRCSRCGRYKEIDQFPGTHNYCRPCHKQYRQPQLEEMKLKRTLDRLGDIEGRREKMQALKEAGMSYGEIGEMFGLTHQRVQQIVGPTKVERMLLDFLDGGHCRMCGAGKEAKLHIHHLRHDNSLNTMVTLCISCHLPFEALCRQMRIDIELEEVLIEEAAEEQHPIEWLIP